MFSYQRYRAVIHSGFPLGIPFLRFCRLENFPQNFKIFSDRAVRSAKPTIINSARSAVTSLGKDCLDAYNIEQKWLP